MLIYVYGTFVGIVAVTKIQIVQAPRAKLKRCFPGGRTHTSCDNSSTTTMGFWCWESGPGLFCYFSPFYDLVKVGLYLSGGIFSTKIKFLVGLIFMSDCKIFTFNPTC